MENKTSTKLPVMATLKKSFQIFFANPLTYFHASWPLLALVLFMVFIFHKAPHGYDAATEFGRANAGPILFALFAATPLSIITVINLYRFILLDEKPRGLALHFGARDMSFLGWLSALGFILILYVLAAVLVSGFLGHLAYGVAFLSLAFYIVIARRLSMLWPAIATDKKVSWRLAFDQSKGNVLRLLGGWLTLFLIPIIFSFLFGLMSGMISGDKQALASLMLFCSIILQILLAFVGVTFTALSYQMLARQTAPLGNDPGAFA